MNEKGSVRSLKSFSRLVAGGSATSLSSALFAWLLVVRMFLELTKNAALL